MKYRILIFFTLTTFTWGFAQDLQEQSPDNTPPKMKTIEIVSYVERPGDDNAAKPDISAAIKDVHDFYYDAWSMLIGLFALIVTIGGIILGYIPIKQYKSRKLEFDKAISDAKQEFNNKITQAINDFNKETETLKAKMDNNYHTSIAFSAHARAQSLIEQERYVEAIRTGLNSLRLFISAEEYSLSEYVFGTLDDALHKLNQSPQKHINAMDEILKIFSRIEKLLNRKEKNFPDCKNLKRNISSSPNPLVAISLNLPSHFQISPFSNNSSISRPSATDLGCYAVGLVVASSGLPPELV